MLHKNCTICKHFKYAENVADGYIEHKTESGEVWMLESKTKHVPAHCPLNQNAYESWFDLVKNMTYDEYKNIDCDCEHFEPYETSKLLDGMIDLTNELLNRLK